MRFLVTGHVAGYESPQSARSSSGSASDASGELQFSGSTTFETVDVPEERDTAPIGRIMHCYTRLRRRDVFFHQEMIAMREGAPPRNATLAHR